MISLMSDSISLDSLSLIPGTLKFQDPNVDSTCYSLDPSKALLVWNRKKLAEKNVQGDSIIMSFRVFPFNLTKSTSHKDIRKLINANKTITNPFVYVPDNKSVNDIFNLGGLNKNGSISRGISFGNSQDVSVNSNLNLQLSGRLSDNIDILLSASDDNIPIQADGNTQSLQEFDKVFIQLSDKNSKLIAGDFVLTRPNSYFMNFNKKAQGLSFTNSFSREGLRSSKNKKYYTNSTMKISNSITGSGAVSKGKFARNSIQGIESNQGPYRLRGADNELFIIVLSGTEKVYIDGELLIRGQENDYVIDYNTAEIRFTPNQKITKDKRILVEFQYSDKNYARSLLYVGDEYTHGKLKLHVNYFSEQDSKNKPLQQELSDPEKLLLSSIGDSLSQAVVPAVDSIPYNTTDVLYKKIDSTTTSAVYTFFGVYVHSTDTSAHYRLSFSYVGAGKGNYNQVSSSANGKVFQWVMPDTLTGALKGSYEPVILLAAPKKKQMLTSGFEYKFGTRSLVYAEGAYTDQDVNLFSSIDKKNDVGFGIRAGFESPIFVSKSDTGKTGTRSLTLNLDYELAQKNFSPIERYRNIEFERDWNRGTSLQSDDQHLARASLNFKKGSSLRAGYQFSTFLEGTYYTGMKHSVSGNLNTKKYRFSYDGSFLTALTTSNSSIFFRSRGNAARMFRYFSLGVKGQYEHNEFFRNRSDTLNNGSYEFGEWEGYISNPDTTKNKFMLSYKQRNDNTYSNYALHKAAFAENTSLDVQLLKNTNSQFRFNITYRNLQIIDPLITQQKPDNSLLGRTEYSFRTHNGVFASATYYEIGSGLELKKEFSFIQVPPGQGVYTWVDYNGDGIKQLNEFEVAAFPDQAIYIKVFTPTDQYVKTYTNSLSQTISLRPSAVWSGKTGMKKFISRFSDQAAYRTDRKSSNNDLGVSYDPFLQNPNDTSLLSLNTFVRNSVYFNQTSSVFGIDHTWSDNRNKNLLTNGFDSRTNQYHEVRGRWNMTKQFTLQGSYKTGVKTSSSQFFSTRDYHLVYTETEPKLSYQPGTTFRVSVSYKYSEKKNSADLGGQIAILNNFGTEIKYNVLNKGSLQLKANYIRISYNDVENSSIAFEMLESLKKGENITWGAIYQRTLSNNMQISFTYDGRSSPGAKIIHVGGAQVRAYF